jgi:hypothetical protein
MRDGNPEIYIAAIGEVINEGSLADGAAYSPQTDAWTSVPPSAANLPP